jgi:hypothetical protein
MMIHPRQLLVRAADGFRKGGQRPTNMEDRHITDDYRSFSVGLVTALSRFTALFRRRAGRVARSRPF